MANTNTNKPFGFSPWEYLSGAPWNGKANWYFVLTNDTGVFSIGDIVKTAASTTTTGQFDPTGMQAVTLAAATDTPVGVVVGVSLVPPQNTSLAGAPLSLENSWLPATKPAKGAYVLVADDPNIVFKVQFGTGTLGNSNSLATAMSKNVSPTITAGTFQSATTLDATSVHTTVGLICKIIGLVNGPENVGITDMTSTTGDYAVAKVIFNLHRYGRATGLVGI